MKSFILLLSIPLIYVSCVMTTCIKSDEEPLEKIRIPSQVAHFSSDSNETTPSDHLENKHHISDRKTDVCKVPSNMKMSQLECNKYANRISCVQTCIFGYTLKEGIQREMSCRFSQNKWEPVPEFEECEPFVDCGLDFSPGAQYVCVTNQFTTGPECNITCKAFEDKSAVRKETYKCNIDGQWSPPLPFCAKSKLEMELVPPPKGVKVVTG